jgi:hypothetical protein
MAVAAPRRLPGIGFEVQAPQPTEVLPRMDVAVFVGFASSGPLHVPVAVEDAAEFTKIFGPDAPLAWDQDRGEQVYAYLGPAVRAFFQNGGRRCWIIRVADEDQAQYNYFPIPGLARATIDDDGTVGDISPAFARARSEGSWSDALEVGSTLLNEPIELVDLTLKSAEGSGTGPPGVDVTVRPLSSGDIAVGDLVQLTFREHGLVLMTPVRDINTPSDEDGSPPSSTRWRERTPMRLTCGTPLWFRPTPPGDALSPPSAATVTLFRPDSSSTISVLSWSAADDGSLTLFLDTSFEASPEPGSVIRLDAGSSTMWLSVAERDTATLQGSPPQEAIRITGGGLWIVTSLPDDLLDETPSCDILTLELRVRQPNNPSVRLTDLGFESSHTLYWGSLPTDADLYKGETAEVQTSPSTLWEYAADPRFPLAGPGDGTALSFPVAMPFLPLYYLGAEHDERTTLERDGLSEFTVDLFLDQDIAPTRVTDLLSEADFLRYQSPTPRALRGIHAALGIDEATIVAIPDVIQRGWYRADPEDPPSLPEFLPLARPEWWHFLKCAPPSLIPQTPEPAWGHFLDCAVRVLTPPTLQAEELSGESLSSTFLGTESGSFVLRWSTLADEDATYVVEESADTEFSDPTAVYSGPDDQVTMYGKSAGQYFYRVRGVVDEESSDWSNGIIVRVGPVPSWLLCSETDYEIDTLLSVHRSAIRLCGARGDLLAVLTLPAHFREEESIKYVSTLKSTLPSSGRLQSVEPLGYGEASAFSYAALYHPWPMGWGADQPGIIRPMPPDGIVCGSMALRASTRGAWIAPANEPMKGIVALSPSIGPAWYLRFQDVQVNLLRREPRGYLCLNSDTLSDDEDLRPINVRRLLILLRRLALRLGASYVFEPNSEAFRRRVQRGFESMLNYMYVRGAFKGATPDAGYQVVTDETINTPQSVDEGRFIVELRVAPSLPMRFLTIRLVQTGDRSLVAIEE